MLLLLNSQNGLNALNSTKSVDNFSHWLIHTLQSSLESHTLESHRIVIFSGFVILDLCQGNGVAPLIQLCIDQYWSKTLPICE